MTTLIQYQCWYSVHRQIYETTICIMFMAGLPASPLQARIRGSACIPLQEGSVQSNVHEGCQLVGMNTSGRATESDRTTRARSVLCYCGVRSET